MDAAAGATWVAAGIAVLAAGVSVWQAVYARSAARSAVRQAKVAEEQLALAYEQHQQQLDERKSLKATQDRDVVIDYLRAVAAWVEVAEGLSRPPRPKNFADRFRQATAAVSAAKVKVDMTIGSEESSYWLGALENFIDDARRLAVQHLEYSTVSVPLTDTGEFRELVAEVRHQLTSATRHYGE